jgi:cell division protease FtsH
MQPSQPTPPHLTGPTKPPSGLASALRIVGLLVVLFVMFLAIWQFLSPTDRRVQASYSDFLADVRAGRVEEIRIHDRDVDYRIRRSDAAPAGSAGQQIRHTVGPVPDQAFLDSLKPADPNQPPPKIVFEK